VQADALSDLKPKGNTISLFELDGQVSPERIVMAVAAGRMKPAVIGYAVFDGGTVIRAGIKLEKILGTTPDARVNALHHDIQELTGAQLNELAEIIVRGEIKEILGKQVALMIQAELDAGHLERKRVSAKLLEELDRRSSR
jgi:hypothetical protein